MLSESILNRVAEADVERKLRAINGLEDGSTKVCLAYVSEGFVEALVTNNGREHAVVLSEQECSCSCDDKYYRPVATCKHIVSVGLFVLRVMQEESTPPHDEVRLAA